MIPANRVDRVFENLRKNNRAALIPYLTAGFPKLSWTLPLLKMLADRGADIIELGVPFSDPIADGPTIQAACKIALDEGTTLSKVLELVQKFRQGGYETPIVLFGALNPFLHLGLEEFARAAVEAGADAVLIPDVPLEEASHIRPALHKRGLHLIPLVAPTTPLERKRQIVSQARGFIYYISVKGVTGARAQTHFDLTEPLAELRALTTLPLVVGFGIASPEQAVEV
ncbi:MAG: tryptophan synthase subunit alpha, partial [Candidatus Sumerlaeaceae bacterium]|nr:tryptophan synthase subunit alpha [Candidatus Sumerlaeaceae bacterium]